MKVTQVEGLKMRLDGRDERLEILNVTWKGCTIRNPEG